MDIDKNIEDLLNNIHKFDLSTVIDEIIIKLQIKREVNFYEYEEILLNYVYDYPIISDIINMNNSILYMIKKSQFDSQLFKNIVIEMKDKYYLIYLPFLYEDYMRYRKYTLNDFNKIYKSIINNKKLSRSNREVDFMPISDIKKKLYSSISNFERINRYINNIHEICDIIKTLFNDDVKKQNAIYKINTFFNKFITNELFTTTIYINELSNFYTNLIELDEIYSLKNLIEKILYLYVDFEFINELKKDNKAIQNNLYEELMKIKKCITNVNVFIFSLFYVPIFYNNYYYTYDLINKEYITQLSNLTELELVPNNKQSRRSNSPKSPRKSPRKSPKSPRKNRQTSTFDNIMSFFY